MNPRLAWVNSLVGLVNQATDAGIRRTTVEDLVDPLKKCVRLRLAPTWAPKNFNPLQVLAHAWARVNDCAIEKMRREEGEVLMFVSLKRRLGPTADKNPFFER